jgi:hypothetical protein
MITPGSMHFLSGDEALAQGAYEAGLRVACSYPGTPATEILEYLARCADVDTQWSVNEKVAYEVALGAAIAGARSLYASKHVGVRIRFRRVFVCHALCAPCDDIRHRDQLRAAQLAERLDVAGRHATAADKTKTDRWFSHVDCSPANDDRRHETYGDFYFSGNSSL